MGIWIFSCICFFILLYLINVFSNRVIIILNAVFALAIGSLLLNKYDEGYYFFNEILVTILLTTIFTWKNKRLRRFVLGIIAFFTLIIIVLISQESGMNKRFFHETIVFMIFLLLAMFLNIED